MGCIIKKCEKSLVLFLRVGGISVHAIMTALNEDQIN